MGHNLNFNEKLNSHAFFSVKEKAWHQLGTVLNDHPTAAEAIELAGLNFTVEKQSLYHGESLGDVSNFFANVRADTNQVLGIVGSKYHTVQNSEVFNFFDAIAADKSTGIKYETAGALGMGEKVFITCKMPDCIEIGKGDKLEKYIFLTTSHDGSGSIIAAFTPVRIVCNNTLNSALKNCTNKVAIKHTANFKSNLEAAAKIIFMADKYADNLDGIFNRWAKVVITDPQLKQLINLAMAPSDQIFKAVAEDDANFEFSTQYKNICENVFQYAKNADSQKLVTTENTIFGAYNAVTGFYQNVKDYTSIDAKLNSILFGTANDRSQKAFNLCEAAYKRLS